MSLTASQLAAAQAALAREDFAGAEAIARAALARKPDAVALVILAEVALLLLKIAAADALARQALALMPGLDAATAVIARACAWTGDGEGSQRWAWRTVQTQSGGRPTRLGAQLFIDCLLEAEAAAMTRNGAAAAPDDRDFQLADVDLLLRHLQPAEARAAALAALARFPGDGGLELRAILAGWRQGLPGMAAAMAELLQRAPIAALALADVSDILDGAVPVLPDDPFAQACAAWLAGDDARAVPALLTWAQTGR